MSSTYPVFSLQTELEGEVFHRDKGNVAQFLQAHCLHSSEWEGFPAFTRIFSKHLLPAFGIPAPSWNGMKRPMKNILKQGYFS